MKAATLLWLGVSLAGAQPPAAVSEILGVVRDKSDRPVPPPIEITVAPCGAVTFDSGGRFRADCRAASVHAGQPIVIRAEKNGWLPVQLATAAPEGGTLASPIRMEKTPAQPAAAVSPEPAQVSAKFDIVDEDSQTTLTVMIRNLTTLPILIDDVIVHVDAAYEIRHAVAGLPTQAPGTLGEQDLPLMSLRSESYKHVGRPLESTAESPALRVNLIDRSTAADRDFIYRARVEVTWKWASSRRTPPVTADLPLFLIGGRRRGLDPASGTQEQAAAAAQWNRARAEEIVSVKAQRTRAVDELLARLRRFDPKEVAPGIKLSEPAAAKASADTIKALLLAGVDRSKPPDPIVDLMYRAAEAGNWPVVEVLTAEAADSPGAVPAGDSALYFAARAGEARIVSLLLAKGVHPRPALVGGAHGGNLVIVQLAFEQGAEPKSVDLCSAVYGRNLEVLKLFLAKGVKTSKDTCRDSHLPYGLGHDWDSAFALAAQTLQEDMLRALLDSTAEPKDERRKLLGSLLTDAIDDALSAAGPQDINLERAKPVVKLLLRFGADVRNVGGKQLATDPEIARMLVAGGADVNAPGIGYDLTQSYGGSRISPARGKYFEQGASAMLYAVGRGCSLDLVKTLRELGAKPVPFRLRGDGKDALNEAVEHHLIYETPESFEHAECLLLAGADASAPSCAECVVEAAARGDAALVRLLLENRADPNGRNLRGTALIAALDGDKIDQLAGRGKAPDEVVRLLLEKGADPNLKDNKGRSPLVAALERSTVPIGLVRLLEAAKAVYDVTAFSFLNYSPLTKCVEYRDLPCVQYLLEKGEDPRKRDAGKRKPLDYATPEIRKALKEAMRRRG